MLGSSKDERIAQKARHKDIEKRFDRFASSTRSKTRSAGREIALANFALLLLLHIVKRIHNRGEAVLE